MLNKLKKNNKKGFTLVELIVVLVILAILAALLVPALTGYIDKAKQKQIIAETRQAVMAAQTLLDEKYATKVAGTAPTVAENGDVKFANVLALAELKDKGAISDVQVMSKDEAKIDDGSGSDIYGYVIKTLTYTPTGSTTKCVYTANPTGTTEKYVVSNVSGG